MRGDKLIRWGSILIFLGVGSFLLPLIGMQFRIFNFGGNQPAMAVIMIIVGAGLVVAGRKRASAAVTTTGQSSAVSTGAARPDKAIAQRPAPEERSAARSCPACGQPLVAGDTFCGACGAAVGAANAPWRCPNRACGKMVPAGKHFCTECGTGRPGEAHHDDRPLL